MKNFLIILLLILGLASPVFSASVVIENYTPEELKATLMKFYIQKGLNISNANEYSITVRENGSSLQNFFGGSQFNPYVLVQTTYNFAKDKNNTILNANMGIIRNANSAYEVMSPIADAKMQTLLEVWKQALNGYYGYGFAHKITRKYIIVGFSEHVKNAQLQIGDKIYMINNKTVKGMPKALVYQELKADDAQTYLKINLLRNKQDIELNLQSKFIEPWIPKEEL